MTAASAHKGANAQTERRVHHKVREVFSEACALIAPALAQGGAPDASVAYILRQRFPELSAVEIHVLLTAAARAASRPEGAAHE